MSAEPAACYHGPFQVKRTFDGQTAKIGTLQGFRHHIRQKTAGIEGCRGKADAVDGNAATWVLVHKFKALFTKHPYSMYELKICRDYRDGKVTKEDLDKCSTCDMNCVINNGLSEASKEQLKHKTGEEIVDADIAQQMETK